MVGAQGTAADSLRALYRWVAQDFRYVSVSLGLGGYQPREPAAVLDTKYGDCKDKTTLFVALARRMGLRAYPVLLSAFGGVDSSLVSLRQFNHMIAAVERPGGYLFLDPTAESVPVGMLPASEEGGFPVVVRPDGSGQEVRLPLDSVTANRNEELLTGQVTPDGSFDGRMTNTFQGAAELGMRSGLSLDIPAPRRAEMVRVMAGGTFEGAEGDSLELFDGRDLTARARISFVIRHGNATRSAGTTEILTLPPSPAVSPTLVAEVAAHVPRHFHIAAPAVLWTGEWVREIRIALPEGWNARLPPGVNASSVFGTYSSTYAQEGRELRILRRVVGARGVFPPEKVDELLAFLRAVARDDTRYIVIEHS